MNYLHIVKNIYIMSHFIEISEVYRIFIENPHLEFSIKYVRATGRGSQPKGSVKTTKLGVSPNVRKLAEGKKVEVNSETKRKYLHKDKWTMSLYDWKKQRPETPLYSHIIEFEGKKVLHN